MRRILWNVAFAGLALAVFGTAGIFVAARANHWSWNSTTCMPIGFYQRGPVPKKLKIGDRVFFCPPVASHAFPKGSRDYRIARASMHQAITGLWLGFSPKSKWACADDLTPFMKEVVALPGQTVQITKAGVIANGKLLPNSRLVNAIDNGKLKVIHLPLGTYTVPKGYFWDYAPGNRAFTSAYYGPVPIRGILGSMRPVLTIAGSQKWLNADD